MSGSNKIKYTVVTNEPDLQKNTSVEKSYSEKARRLIENRENMGSIDNPDARGYFQGRCGDRMRIDLRLEGTTVLEAKFMTDGCSATIACGSMVTQLARSKSLIQAMQITPDELLTALEGLPKDHEHCAELAVMTLREAIIDVTDNPGKQKK